MTDIRIITTADGSHSLHHAGLNETYHSVHGAIRESQYVFIRQGLVRWLELNNSKEIRILEVGFGTGLNALLTLLHSLQTNVKVYYESWEANPLDSLFVQQLNYGEMLKGAAWFGKINKAEWNEAGAITADFTLHKHHGDILRDTLNPSARFDLIYFDAFAPSKQPEMWTLEQIRKITDTLAPGGIWVTYCAKGQVKRDLVSLKFTVETLAGPPGKKEMIRASR